jgi:hypothetical protein
MHVNNAPNNSIASENLNLLYDLILILTLHDIVFLIDFMHAPIKLAQSTQCVYMWFCWCDGMW